MTTLCLQWEPEPAAVAFLYLAAKVSKHDLQGSAKKSWWLKFVNNVDQHDLEDICGIVLDSYEEDEVEKESRLLLWSYGMLWEIIGVIIGDIIGVLQKQILG